MKERATDPWVATILGAALENFENLETWEALNRFSVDRILLQPLMIGDSPFATSVVPLWRYGMAARALVISETRNCGDGELGLRHGSDWIFSFCVHADVAQEG